MAEIATLARPYANAVFDVARQAGDLDRWSRMLALLGTAAGNSTMRALLTAPEVDEERKAYRLCEVCGEELNAAGKRFAQVLAVNKRLPLLPEIHTQFEALRAEEQSTLDVQVTSAFALSEAELANLQGALGRRFNKEINMASSVDGSLIGGAIIRAGDTVIDGSVRGRLAKLAETVQRA
jgi:F-type H+-transporting ATPase subunit delta